MNTHIRKFRHLLGYTFISFLFSVIATHGHAQEVLDNLQAQYEHIDSTNPQRLNVAARYIAALYFHQHHDQAAEILEQNLSVARKHADGKYAANLYAIAAMNSYLSEDILLSDQNLEQAKKYAMQSKDQEIKGYVNYCQGWILARAGQEGEAVRSFIQAITHFDNAPSSSTLNGRKSAVYKELTSIYANWKDYNLQEKYGLLALNLAKSQQDPAAIFDAYMLMGYMYEQQHLTKQDNSRLRNKAEEYYLLAIKTYENNKGEIPFPSNLSFVANNLAFLYLTYYPDSYQKEALRYAQLASDQGKATNQPTHVASAYGIMAEIAVKNNNTLLAKQHLLDALIEVAKSNITDQHTVLNIYESLSELSEKEGNLSEALNYHRAYMETFKSMYDQEQIELGKRLEAQFEKERQQQQLMTMHLQVDKKEQELELMQSISLQQKQEFENLRLHEENQRKQLELSELESEKRAQQLRLSQLESESHTQDILNYKNEISYNQKINNYYISLIVIFILLLLLLLYAYSQRSKRLRQNKELYTAALDKERQNAKISTLTAMLEGQEIERGRLARDLHDGLGGLLSSTKISLSAIAIPTGKELEKPIEQLDTAVEELRRVAHNLMPDLLHKFGLQEALYDYAVRMSNDQLEIDVQFLHYSTTLNKDTQLLVYRIIQELVNNAIKHARPRQIIIQFVEDDFNYTITVEDDGEGFDTNEIKTHKSAGLLNIQSRVDFLKGNLQLQFEEHNGTSVEISFPKTE